MAYKPYTKEQKQQYAKRFTKEERVAYLAGKRQGFLEGVHKPVKQNDPGFMKHSFTKQDFDNLFDDIDKVKLY